jgi:hypothetical protein
LVAFLPPRPAHGIGRSFGNKRYAGRPRASRRSSLPELSRISPVDATLVAHVKTAPDLRQSSVRCRYVVPEST